MSDPDRVSPMERWTEKAHPHHPGNERSLTCQKCLDGLPYVRSLLSRLEAAENNLKYWIVCLDPVLEQAERAEARVKELEQSLRVWRQHESLPDCLACAALGSEEALDALREKDSL